MTDIRYERRVAAGTAYAAAATINGQTMRIANEAYAQGYQHMTEKEKEAHGKALRYMMRAARVFAVLEGRLVR